ncbi:MAG: calcium-binding protein [Sulfitobacter sp.]|nr:calcium-binding protein [Sulfitobacter sp.]
MFFLAGLMGLLTVSAVAYVDIMGADPEEEPMLDDQSGLDPLINLVEGSDAAENIQTEGDMDRIGGGAGADSIEAGAGNDEARGDEGDDLIAGGSGDDSLSGGDGDDSLWGDAGDDSIAGHNNNDLIEGGLGDDHLNGSAGDDSLDGAEGADRLHGGLGDDSLTGGSGADLLFGGWGDDTLDGVRGDRGPNAHLLPEFLNGGGGDDQILAGSSDVVTSGAGDDDIYLFDTAGGQAIEITDYTPQEDALLFVWDDSQGADLPPDIQVLPDPEGTGQLQVWADDTLVAQVTGFHGVLEVTDIALVPQSLLVSLGFATA